MARWWAAVAVVLMAGVSLLSLPAGAVHPATSRAVDSTRVLSISQSPRITSTSEFTISMQVSDTSEIHFVYFTFCQLTSPVCYLPIQMNLSENGWYSGTTHPMTDYPGMNPGVFAGYNITIEFNDSTTVTEPTLPNAFANLTIATSVSGEYMYQMEVHPLVFTVSGVVTDHSTGAPIPGATVTETPGNNTTTTDAKGGYSFGNLENGTYQISVAYGGYRSAAESVKVTGANVDQNIPLTSMSGTTAPPKSPNPSNGFPMVDYEYGAIAVAAVAAVFAGIWWMRRPRSPDASTSPTSAEPGPGGSA